MRNAYKYKFSSIHTNIYSEKQTGSIFRSRCRFDVYVCSLAQRRQTPEDYYHYHWRENLKYQNLKFNFQKRHI